MAYISDKHVVENILNCIHETQLIEALHTPTKAHFLHLIKIFLRMECDQNKKVWKHIDATKLAVS